MIKYRIKIIEKNSGEKEYVPQYCEIDWVVFKIIVYVITFPIILLASALSLSFITVTIWESTLAGRKHCYKTYEQAMAIVEKDKDGRRSEKEHSEKEKREKWLSKVKRTTYQYIK